MSFKVEADNGNSRTVESRSEAEDVKEDMEGLGMDVEIKQAESDGGSTAADKLAEETGEPVEKFEADDKPMPDVDELETVETEADPDENMGDALAELGEELGTDPLSILPGHMVDTIGNEPAVNKRGYAMIAERYGIEASAEIKVYPWDNDEGRCVAKATAITEDGKKYSGWATACADDGDMAEQLIELAETRSLKRSVSWASGVGIVSYQELSSQLE